MATIGELIVNLRASTASFATDLGKAKSLSFNSAKEIDRSFKLMQTAVVGSAVAAAGAIAAFTLKSVETADQMGKMAQRTGLTVEQFSGLAYAAKLADLDTGTLSGAMVALSKNLQKAALSTQEGKAAHSALATLFRGTVPDFESTDAAFSAIAERLAALPDGYEKTALAAQIFGRSGAQLIPLLNEGASGLAKYKKEAADFGAVVSESTAKAAEKFNDNITKIQTAAQGIGLSLAKTFLPGLDAISDWAVRLALVNAAIENLDKTAPKAFTDLRNNVVPATKEMQDAVGGLIQIMGVEIPTEAGQKMIESLREELALLRLTGPEAAKARSMQKAATEGANVQEQNLIGSMARHNELQKELMGVAAGPTPKPFAKASIDLPRVSAPKIAFSLPEIDPAVFGKVEEVKDGLQKLARQIDQDNLPAVEKYREAMEQLRLVQVGGGLSADDFAKASDRLAQSFGLTDDKMENLRRGAIQVREDLSQMFTRAIVRADGLRDALANVLERLAEVILQTQVMDKLFGSGGQKSGGGILGSIFGGIVGAFTHGAGGAGSISMSGGPLWTGLPGFASGGRVSAGVPIMVGERGPEPFIPSTSGTIIPHGAMGGLTIAPVYQIDARGAQPGSEANIRRVLEQHKRETVELAVDTMRDRQLRNAS